MEVALEKYHWEGNIKTFVGGKNINEAVISERVAGKLKKIESNEKSSRLWKEMFWQKSIFNFFDSSRNI